MGFWGILGLIFLIILIIDVLGKNEDEKENEKKSLKPISSNSNDPELCILGNLERCNKPRIF